jgi:fatty-acid desaturase
MRTNLKFKDYVNITFGYKNLWGGLLPMHLLGAYAIISAFMGNWQTINWLYLAAGYFCIMILGVTVCYHRFISHKSFETYKPVEYIILFFAMLAGQGSPIFWTATHRDLHHPHSDKELDPHSPNKGFFTSWFLWLWKIEESDIPSRKVIDLLRNPVYAFCHKHYMTLWWSAHLIFALISVDFWLWFVVVPSVIAFNSYSITNSLTHYPILGYRNYDTDDNSTNVPWMWFFVLGECWHNNHHGDAKASNFGKVRWWEFDPSGYVISLIKK